MRVRLTGVGLLCVGLWACGAPTSEWTPEPEDVPDAAGTEAVTDAGGIKTITLPAPTFSRMPLFQGGTAPGYHSYRIPAIVEANDGTLLAFAEGRWSSPADHGDINIVLRRSSDKGRTWTALQAVLSLGAGTAGNPTPVVDRDTGRVWLFASSNDAEHSYGGADGLKPVAVWGDRRVWSLYSDDHGATWKGLKDRTQELLPPNFVWDAVGPGNGIQIRHGPKAGRLMIPAKNRNIYSDDHGQTWHYQLLTGAGASFDEGTIVELNGGALLRNDRPNGKSVSAQRRFSSVSTDHGATWSPWALQPELLDPICQASILRYNFDKPGRILFLNPASTEGRERLTVRISYDEGQTWPVKRVLTEGPSGYTSMTKTQDYHLAALNESGGANRSIDFYRFNLSWVLNGKSDVK